MEKRFVLASVVGIVIIITGFFALTEFNNFIQIKKEKKLYGTIYEVTEDSEVDFLLFDDHYNLTLLSLTATTFVENKYYSLCVKDYNFNISFLHTISLTEDLSEIINIEIAEIPVKRIL